MTTSTTLQSKISKTKKRLSDDSTLLLPVAIGLMGLIAIFAFALRPISMTWDFGVVEAELPVVSSPLLDKSYKRFSEKPYTYLGQGTPTLILNTDSFVYGDLQAFTKGFSKIRNKFRIDHVEGSPQLGNLVSEMQKWLDRQKNNRNGHKVLIFVPSAEIPMPVLTQVISGIKRSGMFERVVLGAGFI